MFSGLGRRRVVTREGILYLVFTVCHCSLISNSVVHWKLVNLKQHICSTTGIQSFPGLLGPDEENPDSRERISWDNVNHSFVF